MPSFSLACKKEANSSRSLKGRVNVLKNALHAPFCPERGRGKKSDAAQLCGRERGGRPAEKI